MFKNIIGTHKPDILDCISNLSSDEVFTPRITSSFVGPYQGENQGIDVPEDLDILVFDADANKW